MAIVVVSFVALYGVVLQMVAAITVMQEKTLATWVGFDQITELRLSGEFPDDLESDGVAEMGDLSWSYQLEVKPTGSDSIRQVIVRVAPENEPDRVLGLVSGVLVRRATGNITGPPDGLGGGEPNGTTPPDSTGGTIR